MESNIGKVYEDYNIIADWFAENRYQGLMEKYYLDRLISVVGRDASVLDIGCGTGIPMIEYFLSEGLKVTGVEASWRMLELATNNFPEVDFLRADMRELHFDQEFDAIIAWHSFFHLPPADQPGMFSIFKRHLKPGGILLFTSGKEYGEAWGMNGGRNLYHGSLDRGQYESLLQQYGFNVLQYKEDDPDCGFATVWLVQLKEEGRVS